MARKTVRLRKLEEAVALRNRILTGGAMLRVNAGAVGSRVDHDVRVQNIGGTYQVLLGPILLGWLGQDEITGESVFHKEPVSSMTAKIIQFEFAKAWYTLENYCTIPHGLELHPDYA